MSKRPSERIREIIEEIAKEHSGWPFKVTWPAHKYFEEAMLRYLDEEFEKNKMPEFKENHGIPPIIYTKE